MKVAIMGAGLSGLACAITLEKHGITPVIFEKRSQVGDRFVNGEALLSILTRPVRDCIYAMSEQFGIYLHPTGNIQKMIIHSPNQTAVIEGHLGFINLRGRDQDSFEAQLRRQVKSEIHFHSEKTYEDLLREYTHVVMATGDADYAKKTGNFREDLTVSIKGATIEGDFNRHGVRAWLDYDLAPYGYGYLLPISEREASLSLAIPDIPVNRDVNLQELWDKYLLRVTKDLKQSVRITDQFQITRYGMGICHSARVGNTFYVGNCFGSMMPFLGFGQYAAMLTGIYAAYDLCGLGVYEQLTKPLRQSYENALVLRRTMEQLSNDALDRIVHVLNGYAGVKLFHAKYIDPIKLFSYLLRPYVKSKQGVSS